VLRVDAQDLVSLHAPVSMHACCMKRLTRGDVQVSGKLTDLELSTAHSIWAQA
jgi:hypothetical protein